MGFPWNEIVVVLVPLSFLPTATRAEGKVAAASSLAAAAPSGWTPAITQQVTKPLIKHGTITLCSFTPSHHQFSCYLSPREMLFCILAT